MAGVEGCNDKMNEYSDIRVLLIYRNPAMGISIGKTYKQIEEELRKYCNMDSIEMPSCDYKVSSLRKNIQFVKNHLKEKYYDIVHITGAEHYLIPFLKKENTIVTVHDFGFYTQRKKTFKLKLKKMLWIDPLKQAKKIICISNKTLKEAVELAHLRENQATVVYEPVGKEFKYAPKAFNTETPVYLQVGTRPHKNLENTILALSGEPHKLRIIGDLTKEQKKLLDDNGIAYSYASGLTDEEIEKEYEKCDIVNFISMHEGFGMIICEGQAVGRVVVTSNIPPMTEVAENSAVLVDPKSIDSIKAGYKKAIQEHEKYEQAGLQNVKRFQVDTAAKEIVKVYLQVLRKK